MPTSKPFYRTLRPHSDWTQSGRLSQKLVLSRFYASNGPATVRAYLFLQRDFETLSQFIEPCEECLRAYSFRTHELLMRICIELEANFKAILKENKCSAKHTTMRDYRKIDVTHHLSSYRLILTTWHGARKELRPFESWRAQGGFGFGCSPDWYLAYNDSKHDRLENFKRANMETVIFALAGLLAVVTAQFSNEEFSAGETFVGFGGGGYFEDFRPATGRLFRIGTDDEWTAEERYDCSEDFAAGPQDFSFIDYDAIALPR